MSTTLIGFSILFPFLADSLISAQILSKAGLQRQLTDMDTTILDCARIPMDKRIRIVEDPPDLAPRYTVLDLYLHLFQNEKQHRR